MALANIGFGGYLMWPPPAWIATVDPDTWDDDAAAGFVGWLKSVIPFMDLFQYQHTLADTIIKAIPHQPPVFERPVVGHIIPANYRNLGITPQGHPIRSSGLVPMTIGKVGYDTLSRKVSWEVNELGGWQPSRAEFDTWMMLPILMQTLMMVPWDTIGEFAPSPLELGKNIYDIAREGMRVIGINLPTLQGSKESSDNALTVTLKPGIYTFKTGGLEFEVVIEQIEYAGQLVDPKIPAGSALNFQAVSTTNAAPDQDDEEKFKLHYGDKFEIEGVIAGHIAIHKVMGSIGASPQPGRSPSDGKHAVRIIRIENISSSDITFTPPVTFTFTSGDFIYNAPTAAWDILAGEYVEFPMTATEIGRDPGWRDSGMANLGGFNQALPAGLRGTWRREILDPDPEITEPLYAASQGADADPGEPTRITCVITNITQGLSLLPSWPVDLIWENIPMMDGMQMSYDLVKSLIDAIYHHPPPFRKTVFTGGVYVEYDYYALDSNEEKRNAERYSELPSLEVMQGKTLEIWARFFTVDDDGNKESITSEPERLLLRRKMQRTRYTTWYIEHNEDETPIGKFRGHPGPSDPAKVNVGEWNSASRSVVFATITLNGGNFVSVNIASSTLKITINGEDFYHGMVQDAMNTSSLPRDIPVTVPFYSMNFKAVELDDEFTISSVEIVPTPQDSHSITGTAWPNTGDDALGRVGNEADAGSTPVSFHAPDKLSLQPWGTLALDNINFQTTRMSIRRHILEVIPGTNYAPAAIIRPVLLNGELVVTDNGVSRVIPEPPDPATLPQGQGVPGAPAKPWMLRGNLHTVADNSFEDTTGQMGVTHALMHARSAAHFYRVPGSMGRRIYFFATAVVAQETRVTLWEEPAEELSVVMDVVNCITGDSMKDTQVTLKVRVHQIVRRGWLPRATRENTEAGGRTGMTALLGLIFWNDNEDYEVNLNAWLNAYEQQFGAASGLNTKIKFGMLGEEFVLSTATPDFDVVLPPKPSAANRGVTHAAMYKEERTILTDWTNDPITELKVDFGSSLIFAPTIHPGQSVFMRWFEQENFTMIGEGFTAGEIANVANGVNPFFYARLRWRTTQSISRHGGSADIPPDKYWNTAMTGNNGEPTTRIPNGRIPIAVIQYNAKEKSLSIQNIHTGETVKMKVNAAVWFIMNHLMLMPLSII